MFYIMPAWENEVSELNRDLLKNLTNVFVGGKKKREARGVKFFTQPKISFTCQWIN